MTGDAGLAGALAAACADPAVLGKLGGPLGEAARAAAAGAIDRATRVRWAASVRTPMPAGLRGVHPSWIEAGLAGLPARARTALAAGGGDAVDTWLARWATAAIPPMPVIDDRGPAPVGSAPGWGRGLIDPARMTSLDRALRVDAATLAAWLAEVGADQLALALGTSGGGVLAAAARIVGERLLRAAARIAQPPRVGALGPARAAIARCRVTLDDRALVRIGARAIAPHVAGLARRQLAHRLPRPIGIVVGDELAAAAHDPVAEAPRWDALAAGDTLATR